MKEIISLLKQDNKFKVKLFAVQLLLAPVIVIGYVIPFVMMLSGSTGLIIIGTILTYVVSLVIYPIGLYLYVNKLLPKYYEHFSITFGDAIKKGLALMIISLLIIICLLISYGILGMLAVAIDLWLMSLLITIAIIAITIQGFGLIMGIIYAIFENVDKGKKGFSPVFTTYFNNIRKIRKECVEIVFSMTALVVLLYVAGVIAIAVIFVIAVGISPFLWTLLLPILMIVLYLLLIWLALTSTVYVFRKYADIAAIINYQK